MQKVPPLLRLDKNNQQNYDPLVVSLGPYHHGKKELELAEALKVTALQILVNQSNKEVKCFYSQVFRRVSDAKKFYIKDSIEKYDDETFAQMMLFDACFIIASLVDPYSITYLREVESRMVLRDMILLENQIPFWLLRQLMRLVYGEEGDCLLYECLYGAFFGDYKGSGKAWPDEDFPHHLLGACRLIFIADSPVDKSTPSNGFGCLNHLLNFSKCSHLLCKYPSSFMCKRKNKKHIHCFRSAVDLKSKGVHFRPSSADSLKGIEFKSGYFYSELELPVRMVTSHTKILFLNLIAYEMCGNTSIHWVAAYIQFMKSLIDSPKDVKELSEKGILLNMLGSDEEVVKVYKEIKTYGMENIRRFHDTTNEIQADCNNEAKTWLAELFYTHCRSPLKFIALSAAAFLLLLTFLQTYYTVRPS